jgi:hypothetical protein
MITTRDLRTNPFFRSARIGPLRRDATITGQQFLGLSDIARSVRLTVDVDGSAPTWLDGALLRLQEIARLQRNWNSYGAPPIDVESLTRTIDVMNDVMMEHDRLNPQIVPTNNGGIQISFESGPEVLEIIVTRTDSIASYEDTKRAIAWERPLREASSDVRTILQRMFA